MNFIKSSTTEELDVNLTPLIDVVFLLLIFFMVSTTFDKHAELNLKLPEAEGKVTTSQQKVIEIAIDNQGRYFVNQRALVDSQIKTIMQAINLTQKELHTDKVIISSDASVSFQQVITAMDAARRTGLTQINLATRQPKPDK